MVLLRDVNVLCPDRSLVTLPVLGIPASLAIAYVPRHDTYPHTNYDLTSLIDTVLYTCSAPLEFTSRERYPEKKQRHRRAEESLRHIL
ncbi:hypothetical protein F5X96DRAFT_544957 [Biscogniauxia mediterranea]|nr:hypothetical protein F5X96DRAFT_544957 [Biscogniauxia mediterranea]